MRIAIFDYKVHRTNAIGACHLRLMEASGFTTESFVAGWRRVLNELEARDQEIQVVGTVAP
jgi:hypothetical protein